MSGLYAPTSGHGRTRRRRPPGVLARLVAQAARGAAAGLPELQLRHRARQHHVRQGHPSLRRGGVQQRDRQGRGARVPRAAAQGRRQLRVTVDGASRRHQRHGPVRRPVAATRARAQLLPRRRRSSSSTSRRRRSTRSPNPASSTTCSPTRARRSSSSATASRRSSAPTSSSCSRPAASSSAAPPTSSSPRRASSSRCSRARSRAAPRADPARMRSPQPPAWAWAAAGSPDAFARRSGAPRTAPPAAARACAGRTARAG